jgi:DUF917 family protein
LTERDIEAAVKGGSVYAAGGGGWADHGRLLGATALRAGRPELVSVDELPPDAWIATAAAIGAPASTTAWEMRPEDYVKAAQMLQDALGEKLAGFIVGQNGRSSTLNGWLPAVMMGAKVVDAVGDMRAHPTGDMGSIGLAASPEPTIQTAVGGNRAENRYMELVVRGPTAKVSPVLRTAADMAGGFIASCRNPVRASFVASHAALGGISKALALGEAILAAEGKGGGVIDAICETAAGTILGAGKITAKDVVYTKEAFDVGVVVVGDGPKALKLYVMNEYMAVEDATGGRIATFPDVIATLRADGEPLSVGQLGIGDEVAVFHVSKRKLPLGAGLLDPAVYPLTEKALGVEIARYALSDLA